MENLRYPASRSLGTKWALHKAFNQFYGVMGTNTMTMSRVKKELLIDAATDPLCSLPERLR